MKTTDGGESWIKKNSGTTQNLRKVQFPKPNTGYVLGYAGLLKTTDGGESWASIDVGHDGSLYSLSCVDENLIFISGAATLLKSENGGETWISHKDLPSNHRIQFLNKNICFVSNFHKSKGYKTVDGGKTWQEVV